MSCKLNRVFRIHAFPEKPSEEAEYFCFPVPISFGILGGSVSDFRRE